MNLRASSLPPPWRVEWQGGMRGFLRLIFRRRMLDERCFRGETGNLTSREQLEIVFCRDVLSNFKI